MDVVSMAASASLLLWVSSLDKPHLKKLMPRQLWHLAMADLMSVVLDVLWWIPDCLHTFFKIGDDGSFAFNAACNVSIWSSIGIQTSILVEVHIALATGLAICRFPRALCALSRCLPLVWLVGVALGASSSLKMNVGWKAVVGSCDTQLLVVEDIKGAFMLLAFAICFGAYVGGMAFAVRYAGGSVQGRVGRRARWFLAAAVVSWGPYVVWCFSHSGQMVKKGGPRSFYYVAYTFLSSNGLMNASAYAWQCRLYRQTRLLPLSERDLNANVPATGSEYHRSAVSLIVAFASDEEVRVVDRTQMSADERAERGIRSLETSRDSYDGDIGGAGNFEAPGSSDSAESPTASAFPQWLQHWRRGSGNLAEEEFLDCFEEREFSLVQSPASSY